MYRRLCQIARVCFESYGDRVSCWLTIDKQDVIANIPLFNGLIDIKESVQANYHMNIVNALVRMKQSTL